MGRPPRLKQDVVDDLIQQLETQYKIDSNGCWVWSGIYFGNGYGRMSRYRKIASDVLHERAHIASYKHYVNSNLGNLFVCHSCDNKGCINPKHLWLGSNRDNQLDAKSKGVFDRYWTEERRKAKSKEMSGPGNPMYGVGGKDAPCFGRTGSKHPMYGKNHTVEAKQKISDSLRLMRQRKTNE